MDQREKKESELTPEKNWDAWYKDRRDRLLMDLSRLETIKDVPNTYPSTDFLITAYKWLRRFLELHNEQHNKLLDMEHQVKKLQGFLEPLEPYFPILKQFAEEKQEEIEEREKWK